MSARVGIALGAGFAMALAACNTPSAGGPGLEPPGGGDSNDFGSGPGEMMLPTGMTGGAGTGGVPEPSKDPGIGGEPTTPSASDAGATVEDAGAPGADAGTDASGEDGVSCDPRVLTCGSVDPVCPEGQVPRAVHGCFGACVPIDACACDAPEACPDSNHYTCHMFKMRCGPYL